MSEADPSSPHAPSSTTPDASAGPGKAKALPWRKRHPVLARAVLYGGALALMGAGYLVWRVQREKGRQDGLLTKITGVETNMRLMPEGIRVLREDVLAQSPDEDVRRRALLALAACYDAQERFADAESTYATAEREWPAGRPRGALYVPWANERVRAGRPKEALEMLDRPGATEGEAQSQVDEVRRWAKLKLEATPPTPPTGEPGMGG